MAFSAYAWPSDQLFGVILELVLRSKPFDTPSTLLGRLRTALEARVANKGETLYIEELVAVRDFNVWLKPIGVTLSNAFVTREGIFAPHAYCYKLRRDLTSRELKVMATKFTAGCPDDVFCVYKTWMHSTDFKGPLLVLPSARLALVPVHKPQQMMDNERLTAKRKNELMDLADVLRRPQYDLAGAADALVALCQGQRPYREPPTDWLQRGERIRDGFLADTGSTIFGHLPDTSWDLLATFHRR